MNLGQWLKSLSGGDHIILIFLYSFCVYLSKVSLENLIEIYDKKKNIVNSESDLELRQSCY